MVKMDGSLSEWCVETKCDYCYTRLKFTERDLILRDSNSMASFLFCCLIFCPISEKKICGICRCCGSYKTLKNVPAVVEYNLSKKYT